MVLSLLERESSEDIHYLRGYIAGLDYLIRYVPVIASTPLPQPISTYMDEEVTDA